MMTPDEHVQLALNKYAVSNSLAESAANAVAPSLREWSAQYLSELSYSGSYAKGTANNIGTDVDLFISLASSTPGTLKDIYESLYFWASNQGWQPRRQNVSIGINYGATKLDLVPGRKQQGYQNYHSLYVHKKDSWTQSNVSLHVDMVANSSRVDEIRAIKIWRTLHGLDFPSFYLELFVIDALKYKNRNQLATNVISALNLIADSLATTRILDPANTNNVVSDDLSISEKRSIASQARISTNKQFWKDIIW